jgi:hypothetical protein
MLPAISREGLSTSCAYTLPSKPGHGFALPFRNNLKLEHVVGLACSADPCKDKAAGCGHQPSFFTAVLGCILLQDPPPRPGMG